jgi:cytoskeletal protein CcmA (bactofilin family)
MFKRQPNKNLEVDTLIGAKTRIDGNVEFSGGLHVDGYINGDVSGELGTDTILSVSEQGSIEGSVIVSQIILNGIVKGNIEASGRVQLGKRARVLGNVLYTVIETAVGAQINGKLIHRANPGAGDSDAGPREDPQL